MSDTPKFQPNDSAAGGWGALHATAKALRQQSALLKGSRSLLSMNQPDGFDCPGCAWPDPKHTSSFEFCENGAKAVAWETTEKRVTRDFFATWPVGELERQSDYWLEDQGRLTEPMRYDQATDSYVPVSWEDAFALIARELRALAHPNEAEFYTSGRTSNEAAFLYQLFARVYGTNNMPDCSNMCHEPTSVGLPESIGIGKGTVVLEDFEHADAIFILGQNPGTNSPRMMTELHNASRRGAPIIVFNPLKERALERFAAPQDPIEMATMGSTDRQRILPGQDRGRCRRAQGNHEAGARGGGCREGRRPAVGPRYGVHRRAYRRLRGIRRRYQAKRLGGHSLDQRLAARSIGTGCPGLHAGQGGHRLLRHGHHPAPAGTDSVQQVANLLFLRGNIGRPGAGICPVRGHSNVQGDRTVGVDEKPKPAFLDRLGRVFGFDPPRAHGHNVVHAIEAMLDDRAKVFIGMGGNFVAAVPDKPLVEEAMRKLRLTVAVTTKLNRGHLVHGRAALILPCLARSEIDFQKSGPQSVTVEDSMSMLHVSGGLLSPASDHLKSEVAIVCGMARATLTDTTIDWQSFEDDYDRIRDKIEAVFPDLFKDFNARIRQPGGFRLPNGASERVWRTSTGKARFIVFRGVDEDPRVSHPEMLRLATLRSHDQYNTTIYSKTAIAASTALGPSSS